jgi:hypothetical protein
MADSDIEIFGEDIAVYGASDGEEAPDSGSLFKKRRVASASATAAADPAGAAPAGSHWARDGVVFSLQFDNLNDFRQLVALLVQVQHKATVDGVLFHVVQEPEFSGLVTTMCLDSVMLTGRLECKVLHIQPDARTCFYVNVSDLATQLRHIKQDNVCVVTKRADDPKILINAFATGPGTSSTQEMTITETDVASDRPDFFPPMQYGFNMTVSAPDMKALVQQAADISADVLEVTLFRSTAAGAIASLFQFEATGAARCQSVKQRFVNFVEQGVDSEGVFSLDRAINGDIAAGRLVKVMRRGYSVDVLKHLTMSLKNEHQITLSFGPPSVLDETTNAYIPWEEFIGGMDLPADEEAPDDVKLINGALYFSINMSPGSYIKVLLYSRNDGDE